MKKRHYTLIGLSIAALVFAVVVVAGLVGESGGTATQPAATETAAANLPSGHPDIQGTGGMGGSGGGDVSTMVAALEKEYKKDPGNAKVGAGLADAYLMAEQADKAIALYETLLKDEPNDDTLRAQLAMAWHVKGDDARALSLLKDLLKDAPDSQAAHYNLAILYFARNDQAKAKQEWKKAAEIDPKSRLGLSATNFVDLMEGRTPAPTASGHGQ